MSNCNTNSDLIIGMIIAAAVLIPNIIKLVLDTRRNWSYNPEKEKDELVSALIAASFGEVRK